MGVLQEELPSSPNWVTAVVQADIAADYVLFGSPTVLAACILRVVQSFVPDKAANGATSPHWGSLLRLLDAARETLRSSNSALGDSQVSKWAAKLDAAEGLVRSTRILSRHGMHLNAYTLSYADRAASAGLLRALLTSAAGAVAGTRGESEEVLFARLWKDTRDLHSFVFKGKSLTLQFCMREFLRAILLAQQWSAAERCGLFGPRPA
jgi:hypothetical protein